MSNYYEMSGVLPVKQDSHYQIHQIMETLAIQAGGEDIKGRYRYITIPKGKSSCLYLLRSEVELEAAGVGEHQLELTEGQELILQCPINLMQSYYPEPNSKKRKFYFHNETDKIKSRVIELLNNSGLSAVDIEVIEPQIKRINKARQKFIIPYTIAVGTVKVVDVQAATHGLINGIGGKRAFGLGFPIFKIKG